MVAFNFQSRFVQDILHGTKQTTIRQTKRCNVGDTMQLYTGQRTKYCEKIADTTCIGIAYIQVMDDCPWSISPLDGETWHTKDGKPWHELEGFSNAALFVDFFRKQYGLPFQGYVYYWNDLRKETP